ncbi:hypothetical protein SXCC_04881 [Gluconacetobacter sp. SXCC-1]|nr:hypothetical protein SXCC_04881 [Gluconacetobacter sp. SXCC-1]
MNNKGTHEEAQCRYDVPADISTSQIMPALLKDNFSLHEQPEWNV